MGEHRGQANEQELADAARNTCANPAHARLSFARTGWSKGGEFYRWWANFDVYELAPGSVTLAVPLTPSQWSSDFGKIGSQDAGSLDGFRSALRM